MKIVATSSCKEKHVYKKIQKLRIEVEKNKEKGKNICRTSHLDHSGLFHPANPKMDHRDRNRPCNLSRNDICVLKNTPFEQN